MKMRMGFNYFFVSSLIGINTFVVALDSTCIVRNADGTECVIQANDPLVCREQEKINSAKKCMNRTSQVDVSIPMADGKPIQGSFFDRGSDVLLVIGPGFGFSRKTLHYYAKVFYNYDVLIFDYRWKSCLKDFLCSVKTLKSPMAALFDTPKEEGSAVVQFGRSLKEYKKVVGLGVCYSAYQFLAAQAESTKKQIHVFDKLIIDSCPLSTAEIQKEVLRNVSLMFNPSQDAEPGWLQRVWSMTRIPDMLAWLGANFADYSTEPLCSHIGQIPVLCIQGRADRLVPMDSFERIWASIQTPHKMALITPSSHVMNIRNQAIYKIVCDQFIESI
jgi:hypothetical protein